MTIKKKYVCDSCDAIADEGVLPMDWAEYDNVNYKCDGKKHLCTTCNKSYREEEQEWYKNREMRYIMYGLKEPNAFDEEITSENDCAC